MLHSVKMGVVPATARLWQPLRNDGRCFAGDTRGSILVRRGNLEAAYRIRPRDTRMTALNTSDGTRCTFPASYEKLFRVGFPETLPAYLGNLESRITLFDLPLGADVVTRDNGEIVLEVRGRTPMQRQLQRLPRIHRHQLQICS